MTRLFRSKSERSSNNVHTLFDEMPPTPNEQEVEDDEEEAEEEDENEDDENYFFNNPITTPFISPDRRQQNHQFPLVAVLVAALRKSIVTCGVETETDDDVSSSLDIGSPTDVRHVSHVTFDRFNGFLGLPVELQPQLPRKVPSASASVFGVSAKSMQCSYDQRENSVPIILLMMQKRLYSEGGLKAEGIFRITGETDTEEYVKKELNRGFVPHGVDVHCLAGLIKAWFRELPEGVLDSLSPEQVMHCNCNTEEDCALLAKSLPHTEASLLDWAINLMADVAHYEYYTKMNARNIAMVFAPNMTKMADPLTALLHAVQVMNFLKTLIEKTLRERESMSPIRMHLQPCKTSSTKASLLDGPECEECESISGESSPITYKKTSTEEAQGLCDKLNLRKSVRKLCSHPMFQLAKVVKKTGGMGVVNT